MNDTLFHTHAECIYEIGITIESRILEITDMFGREHKIRDFYCINWNGFRV
jgi:hypothetical protein